MSLIMIRHNSLVEPFNDYGKLSVEDLDRLSTCEVSPNIANINEVPSCYGDNDIRDIKNCERFICSKIKRTKESCLAIQKLLQIDKEIIEDEDLNEIYFIASRLIINNTNEPLVEVRNNFYKDLFLNNGALEDIRGLLERCDRVIDKYSDKNVICFSHGFLIRFMNAYKISGYNKLGWIDFIDETNPVGYLEINKL